MAFGIYEKLTKDYILKRITQEQIMEFYLGIPVKIGELICSPLRNDKTPTCSFYYNKQGKLRFRDFSGHFWGDSFDVVARGLGVNVNDRIAFNFVLHTIAKDFKIHQYENKDAVTLYKLKTDEYFKKKKYKEAIKIIVVYRTFNYHDKAYWDKINVNEQLLKIGMVFFAQEIYMSKDNLPFVRIYLYKPSDPAYCYYGGKFPNGEYKWRIYFPFRKIRGENGFLSNSSFLQGRHLLSCGRVCVITKSYKDVLTFRSIGIHAVAPSAESILLTPQEFNYINSLYDFVISCMDYDRAGMRMAQQLRKTYKITPFMFTNGLYNSINYGSKDVSDYVDNKGIEELKVIVQNIFNQYKEDFQKLDLEIYNNLKFIK